jgi:hypothetical protein
MPILLHLTTLPRSRQSLEFLQLSLLPLLLSLLLQFQHLQLLHQLLLRQQTQLQLLQLLYPLQLPLRQFRTTPPKCHRYLVTLRQIHHRSHFHRILQVHLSTHHTIPLIILLGHLSNLAVPHQTMARQTLIINRFQLLQLPSHLSRPLFLSSLLH